MDDRTYDVFVSHHDADRPWVEQELLRRLDERRITYIDPGRFELGASFLSAVNDAIDASRHVVLIVTPHYLADEASLFVTSTALVHMLHQARARVIPVLTERVELPAALRGLVSSDLRDNSPAAWSRLLATLSSPIPSEIPAALSPGVPRQRPAVALVPTPPARVSLSDLLTLTTMQVQIHGRIAQSRGDFEALRVKIRALSAHKHVHDACQRLEGLYNVLNQCAMVGKRDVDWEMVAIIGGSLPDAAQLLVTAAQEAQFLTSDALWLENLSTAAKELELAHTTQAMNGLKNAIRLLRDVLGFVPARANHAMVLGVQDLRLSSVRDTLTAVLATLPPDDGGAPDLRKRLELGITQIDELDGVLKTELYRHDRFQEIDLTLRRLAPFLDNALNEIEEVWPSVMQLTQRLCDGSTPWSDRLVMALVTCRDELERRPSNGAAIRRHFRAFRDEATRGFNETDVRLMAICKELEEEVGAPLNRLLASPV